MQQARGEETTNMVDLTGLSVAELGSSDDPVLLRSVALVVGRTECCRVGVLQNQAPHEVLVVG